MNNALIAWPIHSGPTRLWLRLGFVSICLRTNLYSSFVFLENIEKAIPIHISGVFQRDSFRSAEFHREPIHSSYNKCSPTTSVSGGAPVSPTWGSIKMPRQLKGKNHSFRGYTRMEKERPKDGALLFDNPLLIFLDRSD
jgi:hypothetical protein